MTERRRDIVATWPKAKPLDEYLAELTRAERDGLVINFRVAMFPKVEPGGRCYMIHEGHVRGWCRVLSMEHRKEGEVTGWPAGKYIVRSPVWHPIWPSIAMRGFQGWRYFDEVTERMKR